MSVTVHDKLPDNLTERLARFFRERPNQWVDARSLFAHGGSMGWRSRLSDCRQRYGMTIRNRQRRQRVEHPTPHSITISEYRYEPAREAQQLMLDGGITA